MKTLISAFAVLFAVDALWATAVVEQTTVRQRWPFSRVIDVDYVLSSDPEEFCDVKPTFYDGDTSLEIGALSLSGQFACVSDGSHRLTIDLSQSALKDVASIAAFRVVLTLVESPLYMIVDMRKNGADNPRVTYLTRTDLLTGTHGAYETDLSKLGIANCSLKNPIVWTGCTNDERFVSTHMLFRRILPGSFVAGGTTADAPNVTVTVPFWISVFEYTRGHHDAIVDSKTLTYPLALKYRRPIFNVDYTSVRGSTNASVGVNWPETGYAKVARILSRMREQSGLLVDMPTEAQWELAYRAGTTTKYYTGTDDTSAASLIGRNNANGGFWDNGNGKGKQWHPSETDPDWPSEGFAPAGYYTPNAYGIYDMSGNIEEECLDWYAPSTSAYHLGADPVGPKMSEASSRMRVARGGSAWHSAKDTGVAQRQQAGQDEGSSLYGFRFIVMDQMTQN